jgi:ubiquinol-cytochrome c reductase cytochrome b subunit
MFSAILILLALPFTDLSRSRGIQFRPLSKIAFYIFVGNFLILMQLGAKHVESPFIEFGQISTVIYFAYFLVIIPVISLLENSLVELPTDAKEISSEKSTSFNVLQNKFTILSTSFVVILLTLQSKLFSVDYCDSPRP